MPTKKYTIRGKALWAKVFHHNKELKDHVGNPYPWGAEFKINVVLDKENKAIYKSSGTAGKGKFDDDGNFIAIIKRKEKAKFDWAGGAPKVEWADGSDFDQPMIPNGSDVEVEFTVFTTAMTPGTRLEKVIVHKLAEMPERKEEATKVPSPEVVAQAIKNNTSLEIPF